MSDELVLQSHAWTVLERQFPETNIYPDTDGTITCPQCHGRGTNLTHNFHTMSPSDDYEKQCDECAGEGFLKVIDDRYGDLD